MDLTVAPLSSYPEAVPAVAGWHFSEWGHTAPGSSLDDWAAGMARQADAAEPPGTLIAVADRTPVGVVCLVAQDMAGYGPAEGLTPWLKGLYVAPSARRQGVGGLLVRRCEAWAASLGHSALYLYTERDSGAQALYERLSWRAIHAGSYDSIAVTIMQASLEPPSQAAASGGDEGASGRW
jgi:GNAT superfamily N-acetyltransferase